MMYELKVLESWVVNCTLNIQNKTSVSAICQVLFKTPQLKKKILGE